MTNHFMNLIEIFRTKIKENNTLLRKIGQHGKESLDKTNPLQETQQESARDGEELYRSDLDGRLEENS